MICCIISMITSDILINKLFNDRRNRMNFSIICPEVLIKKIVKTYFIDEFFDEKSPESEDKFPPLKSKENLALN